jgi:glyoxylase-like metal-dependent hydrolase (beta-lactamase superfamily II)
MQLREEPGVNTIWLSHWHEDHITHLDLFDDIPLLMSERDAAALSGVEAFLDAYGMEFEEDREHWRSILKRDFHFEPREPSGFLKEGDVLRFDQVAVEVISTPGHTPGHLSFFFREPGVLFLGDYDLSRFGPWYGDRESSIAQTIESVNRLRSYPARVWLTGHEAGLFEQNPGEIWDRYLGVISKREEKLLAFLEQPRSLEEVVGAWIVYGRAREPKAFFEWGERALMKKHLKMLLEQGRITLSADRYRRID